MTTRQPSRKINSNELTTITRLDLESLFREKHKYTSKQASNMVESIIAALTDGILTKDSVAISGVGHINVSLKNERPGRNPRTGEAHVIARRYSVTLAKAAKGSSKLKKNGLRRMVFERSQDPTYEQAIKTFLETVQAVGKGSTRIELRGFGSFYPSLLPPRTGRNPKSGESVDIGERIMIRFKCYEDVLTKLENKDSK